jgi:hypothetical protein
LPFAFVACFFDDMMSLYSCCLKLCISCVYYSIADG